MERTPPLMSLPSPSFDGRLSRRSRYESLLSKYDAAAEVVRTHADTDVSAQPTDQPIAEEEPLGHHHHHHHNHHANHTPIHYSGYSATVHEADESEIEEPPPYRVHRQSYGGAAAAIVSPFRTARESASGGGGISDVEGAGGGGGGLGGGLSFRGAISGRDRGGDGNDGDDEAAAGPEGISSGGGGLAAGISGALGGLASTIVGSLHLGGPFAAAVAAADGDAGGSPRVGTRAHRERRHRTEKPKKAPALSSNWLKIDFRGVDTVIRVDRHKLMHKLGVQARDLRLLDLTSVTPPAILGRDKAIIVNLWHVKAVITLDYCLVVSPEDGGDLVAAFVAELKAKLSADHNLVTGTGAAAAVAAGGPNGRTYMGLAGATSQVTANAGYGSLQLPFELKVLEVCLDMTAAQLDKVTKLLEADAYPTLDALTHKVTAPNLEKARRIKNRLVRLTTNVESVREVLERFLNDDGDMHRLHLTGAELSRQVSMRPGDLVRLSSGLLRQVVGGSGGGDHAPSDSSDSSSDSSIDEAETAAVEMLLEAYFMQVDHTFNRLQTIDEYIKDTEDLVTIKLDQHRNQLITIDLILTSFTTALSLMTVVGGYFGMNLDSGLQEEPHIFQAVVLTASIVPLVLFGIFMLIMWRAKLLYFN